MVLKKKLLMIQIMFISMVSLGSPKFFPKKDPFLTERVSALKLTRRMLDALDWSNNNELPLTQSSKNEVIQDTNLKKIVDEWVESFGNQADQENLNKIEYELNSGATFKESGIDVNISKEYAGTLLASAVRWNKIIIVRALVQEGADVMAGMVGKPLYWAAENNNIEIANILMNAGADIARSTGMSGNALHCAVENNHYQMVDFLINRLREQNKIEQVINKVISTTHKKTVLDIAERSNQEIQKLLKKNGAFLFKDVESRLSKQNFIKKRLDESSSSGYYTHDQLALKALFDADKKDSHIQEIKHAKLEELISKKSPQQQKPVIKKDKKNTLNVISDIHGSSSPEFDKKNSPLLLTRVNVPVWFDEHASKLVGIQEVKDADGVYFFENIEKEQEDKDVFFVDTTDKNHIKTHSSPEFDLDNSPLATKKEYKMIEGVEEVSDLDMWL